MKKNILVFPCGSEIGLEVYRSLSFSNHFELFGGSSVSDHGKYAYRNYREDLPFIDDPGFTKKLNKIIDELDIDFVIPAHDSVVLKLAQESAAGNLNCKVVTSPAEACKIARSKQMTYKTLKNVTKTPVVYKNVNDLSNNDFPVFLKPDVGQGSKGVQLARNVDEAMFYLGKDPSLIILEYLPGKEYTIDCFTNKEGALIFAEGRERSRIAGGISVSSATVKKSEFNEIAVKLNDHVTFRGAWFFQLKEDKNGELVLMEIATRIAGTSGLVRCKGVNLTLLSIYDAMNISVDIFENSYNICIDRALSNCYRHDISYSKVYIDFDDLIVFNGKVNPSIISFIYQCLNNGIFITLLTRHKDVLEDSLKKYKLGNVFDDIIIVGEGQSKHFYITEKDAIFLDDSFAERKEVHQMCNIPTFDAHTIECLMEK